MVKNLFFIFSLISLFNIPIFAAEVIIKKGDTLTKIANENNTSIRELMDTNNIFDANKLKEGQVIKLPENSKKYVIHIVKKGDSLNQISKQYEIERSEIIDFNKLNNANQIFIGQKIKIPSYNSMSNEREIEINLEEESFLSKKVDEKLSNTKTDSNNELITDKWKNYGPLKINWSSWKFKDGDFLANSIHENGKPLFIAVKCSKRIINRTGLNGEWRLWISPKENFEFELINDVCKKVGT